MKTVGSTNLKGSLFKCESVCLQVKKTWIVENTIGTHITIVLFFTKLQRMSVVHLHRLFIRLRSPVLEEFKFSLKQHLTFEPILLLLVTTYGNNKKHKY